MIARLSRYQIGQVVRDDGPQTHLLKAGTPTMGGTLILVDDAGEHAAVGGSRATASCGSVLGVTFAFGLIGFYDDYLKLVVGNPQGPDRALEILLAVAWPASPRRSRCTTRRRARRRPRCSCRSSRTSPGRCPRSASSCSRYFMIVGMSNAVNLTDGLDGLAIMPAVLVAARARHLRLRERQRGVRRLPADPGRSAAPASC